MGKHSRPDPEITDCGHGHVFLRADKARCGGPGLCRACTGDLRIRQYLEHEGHRFCDYCAAEVGFGVLHRCATGRAYLRSKGVPEERLDE